MNEGYGGFKSIGIAYDRDPTDNTSSVYSPGTGIAINGLEEFYSYQSAFDRDLILVNIGTLLRNFINFNGVDAPVTYAISLFEQEFTVLFQEIIDIVGKACVAPKIVFYIIQYDKFVGDKLLRPPSKNRVKLYNAISMLLSRWRKIIGDRDIFTSSGVEIEFIKMLHYSNWPSETIRNNLITRNRGKQKALLFTHMPLEMHIDVRSDVQLLRSHTGEIVTANRYPEIVFGQKYSEVPFNTSTHAYLGDTKLIIPKLKPKQKKVLLETAIAERWRMRRSTYIKSTLRAMFGPVPNL